MAYISRWQRTAEERRAAGIPGSGSKAATTASNRKRQADCQREYEEDIAKAQSFSKGDKVRTLDGIIGIVQKVILEKVSVELKLPNGQVRPYAVRPLEKADE